jgi:hypothetical protein
VLLAVAVAVLGVVLVPKLLNKYSDEEGAQPVAAAEQDPLLLAVEKCDPAKKGLKLSDGNRKLTVNRSGSIDKSGIGADSMSCVLETLQVPVSLTDRMFTTTEADGRLQGDWPGYTVTWSNDDFNGLDLSVTRN